MLAVILIVYTFLIVLELSVANKISCYDIFWVIYPAVNCVISFIFIAVGYQI